jgi:hypothetical protein
MITSYVLQMHTVVHIISIEIGTVHVIHNTQYTVHTVQILLQQA